MDRYATIASTGRYIPEKVITDDDLNEMLGENVHLELWVKVREHWSDSEAELRRLGFES